MEAMRAASELNATPIKCDLTLAHLATAPDASIASFANPMFLWQHDVVLGSYREGGDILSRIRSPT